MAKDVRKLVGDNVQRLRIEANITQAKLAEKMGVDRAYVSGLELGQRNATIGSLWLVSEALGVEFSALFVDENKRSTKRRSF